MGLNDAASYLFTSESVTEGHPDKLCDQISDAVLDDLLAQDPASRVACEACTTRGLVVVMGEITSGGYADIGALVRKVLRDAGYTKTEYGISDEACGVTVAVQRQSPEIAEAVGSLDAADVGAGDQGMMIGYACREELDGQVQNTDLMPLPIFLSHQLTRRLAQVRKEATLPYLRPDGKSQVTVEYAQGKIRRIHTVVISAQHDPGVPPEQMQQEIIEEVIRPVVPSALLDHETRLLVNPSGSFVLGGPAGDAGLTGRKILVDTYGGMARHGGGAFSGKDPTKVDRSGAYAARYVAKNLVAAGLAQRLELQVSYAIGQADPVSISVETFGTARVEDARIEELVRKHFDLRPAAIIRDLKLLRPIYRATASYGHFGREDLDLPWERTDKVDALRKDAFG
jgi:S-adenosylmethionine synthetase